jgi:cephalosporin-C deacetylase-like acetyl esterase
MSIYRTSVVLLFSVASLFIPALFGAGRSSVDERYQMFQDYLVRRAAETTRNYLADVKSLAEWKKMRPEAHRQFLYMLGLDPLPEKTSLQARVTSRFERDTYRVENVVFQSMPGLYVTGNLYLPKRAKGRLPTVVYLSGHSPGPWGAKVRYQHHGIWFARHGYVCFLLDTIEFGELPDIHHGTHDLGMWYWLSLGYTPAGPEVWNAIRALDYLETRPEVDANRVAVTGISGGGAITWFAAAADERFQVAAPVCATWSVEHQAALDSVHENCDCIYFHNTYQADLTAAGALIAPRPLKILNAIRDPMFPPAGYHEVYKRARPIYELYGAADKIVEYEHDAPHSDILPFRKEADEWINRWLKKDLTPFDEGQIQREEATTLVVLDHHPADAINGYIYKTFIPAHQPRQWKTLGAWKGRRTELTAELKDKVFRSFPRAKVPFELWKEKLGGWTNRYADSFNVELTTEQGIRVTGKLFKPREGKPPYPVLIYVKGAEDVVYPVDYDLILPALGSHVVLVLRPRAVDYPADNYKMATLERTAVLIGATIESMQIWDILRAVDYLVEEEGLNGSPISVYGQKQMGALALYAAALDKRISRVILDDPPSSHWQRPALLNVLRFTDLAEVAAMLAPREIVSLTSLPEAYRYTSSIYRLYGKQNQIRQAHALGDALKVRQHQ